MSAENWLLSVGSMLSTCNKVVQYSWKSSSKLQKTDNDIHNNLSDCGFAVWQFSVASALQSTVNSTLINPTSLFFHLKRSEHYYAINLCTCVHEPNE